MVTIRVCRIFAVCMMAALAGFPLSAAAQWASATVIDDCDAFDENGNVVFRLKKGTATMWDGG